MGTKRFLAAAFCTAAIAGVSAGTALAGETTGNGKPTPLRGNSICMFSGQNDTPNAEFPEGGRVQSYGQLVRAGLKDVVPSPGVACNGHTGFLAGGGEE